MVWIRLVPAGTSRVKIILGFHLPVNPGQVWQNLSVPPASWHCQPREPLLPKSLPAVSPSSEPLGSLLEGDGSGDGRDVLTVRELLEKQMCRQWGGPGPGWCWWGAPWMCWKHLRRASHRKSLSDSWWIVPASQCGHCDLATGLHTGSYWGAGSVEELA